MGYGFPQGRASTSSIFPPPGSMYLGYVMPPPFAQPPAYLNVAQPNHYLYPQPGALAPPAYALPSPLPPPKPQQHLQPPLGKVFAQQGATNPPSSQRRQRGNPNQSAPGTRGPNPQDVDPNTANQQQGTQPKLDRPLRTNKPCSCCGVYGHYTHDCPLLPQMRQMWESQATLRGQHASPHAPPNVATTQPAVFTDPFPQQGFVATQPPNS